MSSKSRERSPLFFSALARFPPGEQCWSQPAPAWCQCPPSHGRAVLCSSQPWHGLLVLNLGSNGGNLLLLALDSLSKLRDDSLQIRNSLLGQLEVAFNLSLHLLSISLGLLFSLKSILTFIKGLFKFTLDLAEVVASVLHGLDVLLSLLSALSSRLLVLAKL